MIAAARRSRLLASAALGAVLTWSAASASADASSAEKRPFTVNDAIEWKRIAGRESAAGLAVFSPDASKFLIRVYGGDLETDENVERFLVFNVRDVDNYLTGAEERPPPYTLIAEARSADMRAGASSVQWIGDEAVAYIAPTKSGRQVFVAHLGTRRVEQLTSVNGSVAAFSSAGDTAILHVHQPPNRSRIVRDAGGRSISDLAIGERADDTPLDLYKLSLRTGALVKIDAPAVAHGLRESAAGPPVARRDIRVFVTEGMNDPPVVRASSTRCQCEKLLFDPNPQAAGLLFGKVEPVEWIDANENRWRGGLVYPAGYAAGKRYPLVVQTHGFEDGEFLVDGPREITTAMAAQPLSSAGFFVLQIRETRRVVTMDEREIALVSDGYKAGIDAVIARGLADPARIGLVGFSRTASHAIGFLARYPEVLAAVILADGTQPGYMQDVMTLNTVEELAEQQRRLSGGSPAQIGYGKWFEQNPLYRIGRIRAAIRIEGIALNGLMSMWETLAVLRRAGNTVDFVYYPEGNHLLATPSERLESQGGALQWFTRWLRPEGPAQ